MPRELRPQKSKVIWIPQELRHFKWFYILLETHSRNKGEKDLSDEFKGQLFFSHGKSNSCEVPLAVKEQKHLNC